ncbi:MAG: C4-dicarboxylate transporter DctA [Pirellulaceae bacterium]|nr:C4-dicarboxylate transporter DctA [Pirellulaceae bacterium]
MISTKSVEQLETDERRTPWYKILYVQTILAVLIGIAIGHFLPTLGKQLEPLSKGFIALIKMMIGPIIFCTVVHGIASIGDLKRLGRLGLKALIYFEVISTIALIVGLLVVNVLRPGDGFTKPGETFHAEVSEETTAKANAAIEASKEQSHVDFFLHIIPTTFMGAFVSGDLLQVLFISFLVAIAILSMGERGEPALRFFEYVTLIFFGVMNLVVRFAPLGALGAMSFTISQHGLGTLGKLLYLMVGFYLTSAIFVFLVLGTIAWFSGFSIVRFLIYIKEELVLVLGTSSSETALPGLMKKTQALGCSKTTVNFVIPTGYSFNLDGTNIYMSMAAIFLAQATNTQLSIWEQVSLLAIAMLTSKGSSGVTGAGFVTLAATLQVVPRIPIEALPLLLGIDRFMSECRAITNFIGNGVATIVISRWEKELTVEELQKNLG